MMLALFLALASVDCAPEESCVRRVDRGAVVEEGYWLSAPYLASITARLEGEEARTRAAVEASIAESAARCASDRAHDRVEIGRLERELSEARAWYRSPTVLMAIAGTMLVIATGVVVVVAED